MSWIEPKVVIPSHKRAGRVTTHELVEGAVICVPQSQAADYRREHPEAEIVEHPDSVVGLPPKRQWICDTFGDVFMVDDDMKAFTRHYETTGERVYDLTPREAREVIETTANVAQEMGAYLFGFSDDPIRSHFEGFRPFRLTGYCNGCAFGLLSGSPFLKWPMDFKICADFYMSLLNAYHHRYAFYDYRFAWIQAPDTMKNPGGQSEFRSMEVEKEHNLKLKRLFGDAIRIKHKPRIHSFQRGVNLPF